MLLRRGGKHGDRALEVLLLKRTEEAKFMPSVWVFPGGGVDAADGEGEAGHRACAVRELAEEASIELGRRRGAGPLLALDHARGDLDAASTPGSSSPSRRPTRRPSRTGSRRSRRPGSSRGRRSTPSAAGELVLAFPTIAQLGLLADSRPPTRPSTPTAAATIEPILPKVVGTSEDHRVVLPGDPDYPG